MEKTTSTTKNLQKHKNLESNKEFTFNLQIRILHNAYDTIHKGLNIKTKLNLKVMKRIEYILLHQCQPLSFQATVSNLKI